MKYDFSASFKDDSTEDMSEFLEQYTSYLNTYDEENVEKFINYYKEIFNIFKKPFEEKAILNIFENLAAHKVKLELPYVIVINELFGLKNIILKKLTTTKHLDNILDLLSLFNKINNKIAKVYLALYVTKLQSINNVRRSSLSDLIDKSIISHYESHLIWLSALSVCIEQSRIEDFPELDEHLCDFGVWLHGDAKIIIQNNSKYKTLNKLHDNLHFLGRKVHKYVQTDEYHLLITYLEKSELISLSIGTELALMNNILLNKKVEKDALTGALSRGSLVRVFENQYDLSLATGTPFVLAMCDLDNFKSVNDTYGHVTGDKMLEMFVDVAKSSLRNSDIIIRYGGEEFVILLPSISREKAFIVLDKIRENFEKSILKFQNREVQITVSIGMTEINPEFVFQRNYLDEYVSIADKKLYKAKNGGRNRVVKN